MRLLIEKGLMFGNLIRVDSPVWVDRYNRALHSLTGRTTKLSDFHIDISGYSPEIGDEFDDTLYLNQAGVNRQFILLTTEQKTAPLLNASFSTSRGILRQFITENEPQLFALTAVDAVAGELVNSVYSVDDPRRLFDIYRVSIDADTTKGTLAAANKLGDLINTFKSDPDAWFDDVLIAKMISLSKQTGDVTRNPVRLKEMVFDQSNYWTAHFGGLYIFRNVDHPAAISVRDKSGLGTLPISYLMDFDDRAAIAKFLQLNNLAEPVARARGIDAAAILHQKMDFIVADIAGQMGEDLSHGNRRRLRGLARRFSDRLPREWQGLAALARWAEEGASWPRIDSSHPAYFYTLRASDHADADLVNMLLAELAPLDFRQLFICHKEAFYRAYSTWSPQKQAYVASFLEREYQVDKAGMRAALFAHAPATETPQNTTADLIDQVGPWGAIRRR